MRPAPGVPIEQQPEIAVVPMMLWGEARGESAFTKLAILWTAKNAAARAQVPLKQWILTPKKFSCFNHDDPNLPKLLIGYKIDPVQWAVCEAIQDLLPFTKDPTSGSTHYYNFKVVQPVWGRGNSQWKERLVIGDLVFGDCP